MDEEVKALKARLKAAGVNRTVAGINAAEEEEYYDEEDDGADEEKKEKEEEDKDGEGKDGKEEAKE